MTLLDRFRAQSPQKHADPAVRLAYVQELPVSERELLLDMARDDADARVRRAAVSKLLDPSALASIASADSDASVRDQATAMLRDIALDAFEGVSDADTLAAVDALADPKALAVVAKSSSNEAAANHARARISDPHVLGSIARHAEHESVRRSAFDAISDTRELLALALNSEFREPALTAVDRITDRAELDQLAARAKNRTVSKRARTILREMDERDAKEREAALAAEHVARAAAAQAEQAERDAQEAAAREQASADEAAQHAAEAAATAAADEARAREAAERERVRAEATAQDAERLAGRQRELADDAARVATVEDLHAARRQFSAIRREWADVVAHVVPAAEVAEAYNTAASAIEQREAAARETDQKVRREALVRLQQLADRIDPIAAKPDVTLKAGERALRDIRSALGTLPHLPTKQDHDDILQRLKGLQAALTPRVQELREVAGWQRWANVGIQEQLVEKMEALKALEDAEAIARQVKELQAQWRTAADVPRAQGEALWRRFKTARDEVWAKCEAHFAQQAGERSDNHAKKIALCERAEALMDSTSWIQTADEIKQLQADWKTIGPVSRGQEKAVWERFRAACDRFFTRRHADLAERKSVWSENLAKKEAIIVQVEALADSTEWDATSSEIKRLQGEWKTIGPVKKSRSEALWQRFRAACDRFFSRYAQRHDIARGERVAAREAIVSELEGLASAGDAESSEGENAVPSASDVATLARALRERWQREIAARGVDRERAVALDDRFAAAFARVVARWPAAFAGTDLDLDANRKRMESLVTRMEDLAASVSGGAKGSGAAGASSTSTLAAMLKEALASNTIGGKVDPETRYRAANEEVRQAQAAWSRIGPVAEDARRALADRMQRAVRRISDAQSPSSGGRDARDRRPSNPVSVRPDVRDRQPQREKQEVG